MTGMPDHVLERFEAWAEEGRRKKPHRKRIKVERPADAERLCACMEAAIDSGADDGIIRDLAQLLLIELGWLPRPPKPPAQPELPTMERRRR